MIFTRETIVKDKIRVFDAAGLPIGLALLIDDVNMKVWSAPLFLRDCPDPDAVLKGISPEDAPLRIQEWQDRRGPIEIPFTRIERG